MSAALYQLKTGRAACERRGHHGPFANGAKYDAVPGWEGIADCLQCGSTVRASGGSEVRVLRLER